MRRRVQEGSEKAVDKQEQSHRPKPSRLLSTRAARQRRTPSDNRGLSAEQKEFQQACAAWAVKLGVKLNALFNLMPQYGKSVHWARERHYGGTFVTDADIFWVKSRIEDQPDDSLIAKLHRYTAAVDLMCRVCAGDETTTPTCWDQTCPLRSVSPLPLRNPK